MPKKDQFRGDIAITDPPLITPFGTLETSAYLNGLSADLEENLKRVIGLTKHLREIEARMELAEKHLCLTREHLAMAIREAEDVVPANWGQLFARTRFVGVRLADACAAVVQERKKLGPDELLRALNNGNYRFRTSAPLREIHAALLKHPHVERDQSGNYVWTAPREKQIPMRLRVSTTTPTTPVLKEENEQVV